jgi:hypothetical protein
MKPAHLHDIKTWAPQAVASGPLGTRAQRLYPNDDYLQTEWMRAVGVVRRTTNGWVCDNQVPRETPRVQP